MTTGLSHITLISADPDRMEVILTRALGARKIYDSGAQTFSHTPERFYDIGGVWVAVMHGPPLPARSYNHIAFCITEAEYDDRHATLRDLGLDVTEGRARVDGEGRSLYFHTPDNHLIELHTGTLETRLARYAKGPDPE